MTHLVDLFWSFRSPYSYLALPRLMALEAEWDITIHVRPVRPLALRQPDFFEREDPMWMGYLLTDVLRLADYLGMPIGLPSPDPVLMQADRKRAAPDQPHIHRLTRIGLAAAGATGLGFLTYALLASKARRLLRLDRRTTWSLNPRALPSKGALTSLTSSRPSPSRRPTRP